MRAIILQAVFIVICYTSISQGSFPAQTCFCTSNYDPVCGSDRGTYSNDCELGCAQQRDPNLRQLYRGRCQNNGPQPPTPPRPQPPQPPQQQNCFCIQNIDPVCGSDGYTYTNECELECKPGVTFVHRGRCPVRGRPRPRY